MRFRRNSLTALTSFVLSGIGLSVATSMSAIAQDAPPPTSDLGTDQAADQSAPQLKPIDLPTSTIEMWSIGAEPQREVRIAPRVGDRHRLTLTMENLRNQFGEDGTRQLERPLPFVTLLLAEVTDVAEDGSATVALTVESSVAQPSRLHTVEEIEAMRAAAGAMEGLRLEYRVAATGRLLGLRLQEPTSEDESHAATASLQAQRVAAALARTLVPLPDEEIGLDAEWSVRVAERFADVDRTQRADYRLVRLADGVATIARQTRISAPIQPGNPDTIPGAVDVEISHHSGFGQGESTRSLSMVFPDRFTDETIATVMTSGRIAGERIIVNIQHFARITLTTEPATDAPRRRIGE